MGCLSVVLTKTVLGWKSNQTQKRPFVLHLPNHLQVLVPLPPLLISVQSRFVQSDNAFVLFWRRRAA